MPKRRPQSADLADRICDAVKELTAARPSRSYAPQWIMVSDIAARLGLDESVVQIAAGEAADRYRLAIEGEPAHSVSLIDRLGWQ
jgi:hypothetical protein